ncbi:MAG: hypothetical protein GY729_07080 [Desulfobacteraceae bacterium]|nr:hypothetical protein [Desulfobacteraceae bacterium]
MENKPDGLCSFQISYPLAPKALKKLEFECLTTLQISLLSKKDQNKITQELCSFFPKMFKDKKDWEYMVRHFFYLPKGQTARQAIFVRDQQKKLVAVCAFDTGNFTIAKQGVRIIYIHIRAVDFPFRQYGIGRIFSQKILTTLQPDILLTTCVQLSSLYSWIRIKEPFILKNYEFFPRLELTNGGFSTIALPAKDLDTAIHCFKMIYKSHVKEDKKELDDVVNNITINMVRKGVDTFFDYEKWNEQGSLSQIARDLCVTQKDAILLMIRKKGFSIDKESLPTL